LIHEKTVSERNLIKAIQTKDALVSVLAHELATRRKELEDLHRELDLAMGVDQRNKTTKQTMEELQKNIRQIMHGDFNGIFDGNEEDRMKLKAHLSQVIKKIEITHYWKIEGKDRAWIAKIIKRNGQAILATHESQDEVYCLPYAEENQLGDKLSEMEKPSQMEEKLETVH
jgi:predicted GNAT family acetyltransferase